MLEHASALLARLRAGEPVAVVTVVAVARSAPRGIGASLAVTADGDVIGSLSGGCIEGDAITLAHAVLATGVAHSTRLGSTAHEHAGGLACGGAIDVLAYRIEPGDETARSALERAASDLAATVGLVVEGAPSADRGPATGAVVSASVLRRYGERGTRGARALADDLDAASLLRETRPLLAPDHEPTLGVVALTRAPRARLIVLGAGEHAAALTRLGAASGFAVTVCDPWELLVTRERFPDAERLVHAVPHEYLAALGPDEVDLRTAVCVLTHDDRLDVPAIRVALGMPIGFVGAMGARATVSRRADVLRAEGVSAESLARLHSPLGLDLGGGAPEEAAVAALAEIIAARHGASGAPLRDLTGPIRRTGATAAPRREVVA